MAINVECMRKSKKTRCVSRDYTGCIWFTGIKTNEKGGKCSQSTQLVRKMLYSNNETTCFGL